MPLRDSFYRKGCWHLSNPDAAPPATVCTDIKAKRLPSPLFTENSRRGVLERSITLADFLHRKGRLDSKPPRVIFVRWLLTHTTLQNLQRGCARSSARSGKVRGALSGAL